MPFYLRRATSDDAATLARLIRELANYEKLLHEADPDVERLGLHLKRNAVPRAYAFLACDEATDDAIGFALFYDKYSTFRTEWGIHLEDLYVTPEFRGRGVGSALLKAVAGDAIKRKCGRLEWNVLDWNSPAIRFYESIGARHLSDWQLMRLSGDDLAEMGDSS